MRYRGLILFAFALATFATLRLTMGPRMHHGGCGHSCQRATCEAPLQENGSSSVRNADTPEQ